MKKGVLVEDFFIRKIDFDERYVAAIEQQQIAQENIETASFRADAAEFEKQIAIRQSEAVAAGAVLQAKAEAERTEILAVAEANAIRVNADAVAYSIGQRGGALRGNEILIQWDLVVNMRNIEWGILPSEVVPLLDLQELGQ